jgi:hypothetical protein
MKTRRLVFVILFISLLVSCSQNTDTGSTSTAVGPTFTAPATVIPTAATDPIVEAQNAGLLYSQNFETGSDEGIYDFGKENFELAVDDSGNHIYCNKGSVFHSLAHFGVESWTNYAVEIKFKFVHFGDPATMDLFARMDKRANGYVGEIDQRNQSVSLLSNPNGKVVKTSSFLPVVEQWYTLRMELVGSRIQFFVDNTLFEEMNDTDYSRGKAGFDVAPSTLACVDDIRAWALTDDGQIARLSDKPEPRSLTDRLISHKFPKLFYMNQDYGPTNEALTPAYYYDILLFDKEVAKSEWAYLGPTGIIRSQNPNTVVFAMISNQEFFPDDESETGHVFVAGLKPEWAMQDVDGNPFPAFDYGGGYWSTMLNLSTDVTTYIPQYLNQKVISTGLFDGIFYDGTNETWWQADPTSGRPFGPIDFNHDGKADTAAELTTAMDLGVQKMLVESRKEFPADTLISGNAGWNGSLLLADDAKMDTIFADLLNGRQIEGFLNWEKYNIDWLETMRAYYFMQQVSVEPKTPFILAYCTGTDYDHLRYVLASSLMLDGYFTCTDSQDGSLLHPYTSNWWYDEYSVDLSTGTAVQSLDAKGYLGLPVTEAYNTNDPTELLTALLVDNDPKSMQLVWRRDFEHGIVLINPSGASKSIDLNGTYRKIQGDYDPQFNDGSGVTKVTLPPKSGIILLNP